MFAELESEVLAGEEHTAIREGLARALAQKADNATHRRSPIDWDTQARRRLDDPTASARDVVTPAVRWRPGQLEEHQRERLETLVKEAWPDDDVLRNLRGVHRLVAWEREDVLGAVNAAAALDLPLTNDAG